ncbi:DNA recombination protein RmuC [Nocardioides donggukensis]|uniref:DNA recombination protein RmuC n=1 Tax=Nocardioides donggukensis TaxID=2774019 RepID=A0A927Q2G0_9ACTN|nr:DNA recombination protein RmuC [Nocardioides donggukensis]MBD8870359.1 DNA recombination protein RmuC [Nocardioides donggukensis]
MEMLTWFAALTTGLVLGGLLGVLWARTRVPREGESRALEQRAADQAVVREGLERLADQMRDLEHDRATWQGQFNEQVTAIRHSTDTLRRETQSLATALRKPQVRGRWGELHLRRAVELAGLVERCDFSEQVQLDGGALRPDLVVHLAGDKSVVVDAKVPLDAFLDATSTDDEAEREAHLRRHARQLRTHTDALSAKRYWRSLEHSPEFVVLFIPAEAFLSAALEADPALLEHAATRRVVLATPTTLIALLRTVAQGWTHEALADRAREIHELGRELHERLATMGAHVDKLGRSLGAAVEAYNGTVGSLEGRVLVSARRFTDLGLDLDDVPAPRQLEVTPRSLGADEFAALGDDADPFSDPLPSPPARRARGA